MRVGRMLCVCLAAVGGAAAARPDGPGGEEATRWWLWGERRPSQWTVQVEPSAWWVGLAGDLRIGGGSEVDLKSVDADEPGLAPAGEAHIRGDIWTVSLSGFGANVDESGTASAGFTAGALVVPAGASVRTSFDYTGVEATVSARVWRTSLGEHPLEDVEMRLHLYGGARAHVVDVAFSSGGGSAGDSATWVQPLVGAKFELEIWDRMTMDVALDYGVWPGGSNDISGFNVIAGFQWHPWGNVGVQIGYRMQVVDGEDGGFSWDGSAAGVYGGAVIRF